MRPDPTASVTLRDIAKRLGLAHSTVSDGLRESPRVTPELRRRIQQAAKEMGYHPNAMAVALGRQRQECGGHPVQAAIAWLNLWDRPEELHGFRELHQYWCGAYQAAEECGYRLEEIACHDFPVPRLAEILKARNIRAIILPPTRSGVPANWKGFPWENFSIIRIGYTVAYPPAHIVAGNHLKTGLMAYENMWRAGYRRIGYVYRSETPTLSRAGFLMRQTDLAPEQRKLVLRLPETWNPQETQEAFATWLHKCRPDAIFTDIAAMREMIRLAGWEIPRDIGLASMSVLDGNADAGVAQNSERIGRAAVDMLVALVNRNHRGIPASCQETLVEAGWVDGTTLPPRTARLRQNDSSVLADG